MEIVMKVTKIMQGVRIMRFSKIYTDWQVKKLTVEEAAELLGVHERTFQRQCRRYEENGAEGLLDARISRRAHNAAPIDEVMNMLNLFETKYSTFNAAHFYDHWRDDHNGKRSYVWVKNELQKAGLAKKSKKKGAHRRKRPRKPMPGMMIHQDASTHEWVPDKRWDLIVTMDDATSEIYSAFFVEEEGTWSSFEGVRDVIENKGLFCTFYSDRGSHYWNTPAAGGKVDKKNPTQFGRAMDQLGIPMIAAYSPEARGRSERMFKTLQGRLPNELALYNITTMPEANKFLKNIFLSKFNSKFMVKAAEKEKTAFVPWLPSNFSLKDILCIQDQRVVNKDNTVRYETLSLQIPKDQYRYHYVKATVCVHEYLDGSLALFHGPRRLADYDELGQLKATTTLVETPIRRASSS